MSYRNRNTLVLAGILGIILVVGSYLIFLDHPEANKNVQAELSKLNRQIELLSEVEREEVTYDTLLAEQARRLEAIDKELFIQLTPDRTYAYLNDIMNRTGYLPINLRYTRTEMADNFGYQLYQISGESTFDRIYHLVQFLEKGPLHTRIRHFAMRGVESSDRSAALVIPFEMEIAVYFSTFEELPTTPVELSAIRIRQVDNPFQPLLRRSLPPNRAGLLEVERATLQALVPGKALIADHTGKIHELQVGDKVYLGYLSDIRLANSEAEFILNKGGVVQKYTLSFNFGSSN